MTAISSYFAQVGINVDTDSLNKVDAYFRALEGKFTKIRGKLGDGVTLRVNAELQFTKSYRRVRDQLAQMGNSLTLTIKKLNFGVNAKQIKSQAEAQLKTGIRVKVNPYITQTDILALRKQIQMGMQSVPVTLRYAGGLKPPTQSVRGSGGSSRGGSGLGSIPPFSTLSNLSRGLSGFFLRGGVNALPFIGGAMGVNRLQEATTQYQSNKIASDVIFANVEQLPGGGDEARQRVFDYAMQAGLRYKDILPEYNKFMSTAMPSMGYEGGDKAFKAITAYGMTHGSDPDSINRAMKAITQMAGKGRVGAEELRQQLADAAGFGGANLMFAEAYAKKKNTGKTGQEAIADLEAAMKKGLVKTAEVLPLVVEEMAKRAAPGMKKASETSTAEKNRAMSMRDKMFESFTKNGGEKGLATMWQAIERVFTRLQDRMPQIGRLFEGAMNVFADAVDGFMDISDALFFGRESELTKRLKEFGVSVTGIGEFVATMTSMIAGLAEKLGVGGSIAALAGLYATTKIGSKLLNNKAGQVLSKVTGGAVGGDSLSSYGDGYALRVKVVGFEVGASTPRVETGGGNGKTQLPEVDKKKEGWRKRAGNWFGKQSSKSSNTQLAIGLALAGMAVSQLPEEKMNSASTVAGPMGATPFGWLMAKSQDLWKEASVFNAEKFTESKISAATPITDKAMQGYIPTLDHKIDLKANIKIEAGTPDEALTKFRQELDAQIRQSFMLPALKEAQSTFSNYAK